MGQANVGLTNLNNSEKWLLFDVNDKAEGSRSYISATNITMVAQDAADNTITYVYYKSGVNSSTVKIIHPADTGKLLVDDIYKALFTLPTTEKQLIEQVISTIRPTSITTGCDICPTKVQSSTHGSGVLPTNVPLLFIDVDGTKAYTLADGSAAGDKITIIVKTATNTPAGTLTPTSTSGAWATAGFNAVGQTLKLVWTATGWAITGRESGSVAGRAAVAGLIEIA